MENEIWIMPEKKHLSKITAPIPSPDKDQVVVKMEYCGICGSDMHFFHNGHIGTRRAPENFILGHESAGTVVEVGEEVSTLKVGDRVALEPGVPCGSCEFCRTGKYNLCPDVHFMAAAMPPTQGALRKFMAYPAKWCFKLPENVSTLEGCMIEPLAVGMHAATRGEVSLGKTVLILGAGTIGFMTMLSCKAMGASKIIVTDILENRLAIAKEFGCDVTIRGDVEDVAARILEETQELGCDIVFEASGNPTMLAETWKYVKRGGVIVNVGNAGGAIPYTFDELARKEADIRQVWRYRHMYPVAIQAVASGSIPLKKIDPTIFPFEDAEKAFFYAFEQRSKVLKTVIQIC